MKRRAQDHDRRRFLRLIGLTALVFITVVVLMVLQFEYQPKHEHAPVLHLDDLAEPGGGLSGCFVKGPRSSVQSPGQLCQGDRFATIMSSEGCVLESKAGLEFVGQFLHLGVKRVIVWGLKLSSGHTHAWIHFGLFRAVFALAPNGMEICWIDQDDMVDSKKFNHTLFITSPGHGASPVPISDKSFYVFTGPIPKEPRLFASGRAVTYSALFSPPDTSPDGHAYSPLFGTPFGGFISPKKRSLMMPWATDLLPSEVEANKELVRRRYQSGHFRDRSQGMVFVGSGWHYNVHALMEAASTSHNVLDIPFHQYGNCDFCDDSTGTYQAIASTMVHEEFRNASAALVRQQYHPSHSAYELPDPGAPLPLIHHGKVSPAESTRLVQKAYLAPAVQGAGHVHGCSISGVCYIPCRIFKNIGSGAMGVSNNPAANRLFKQKLIFDRNVTRLIMRADQYMQQTTDETQLLELMDMVRDRHTYVDRVIRCLRLLVQVYDAEHP